MTKHEWAQAVLILRNAYPTSFKLDMQGLKVWHELLGDLPGEAVIAACIHMAKVQPAFPSVADIRAHVEKASPSSVDPLDAWAEALKQNHLLCSPLYRGGQKVEPEWTDPDIPRAIERIGGCTALQAMESGELPSYRARFVDAFADLKARAARTQTFEQLGAGRAGRRPEPFPLASGPSDAPSLEMRRDPDENRDRPRRPGIPGGAECGCPHPAPGRQPEGRGRPGLGDCLPQGPHRQPHPHR